MPASPGKTDSLPSQQRKSKPCLPIRCTLHAAQRGYIQLEPWAWLPGQAAAEHAASLRTTPDTGFEITSPVLAEIEVITWRQHPTALMAEAAIGI